MSEKSLYTVELYEPDSISTVVGSWDLTQPVAVSVGDIFHTTGLEPDQLNRRLKVVRVEHFLWPRGGQIAHKLMLFTELEES